jgi:hypothetical protein
MLQFQVTRYQALSRIRIRGIHCCRSGSVRVGITGLSVRIHLNQCKANLYRTFSKKNSINCPKILKIMTPKSYNTEEKDKSMKIGTAVKKTTKFSSIPTRVTLEVGSGSRSGTTSRHQKRCRWRSIKLLGGSVTFLNLPDQDRYYLIQIGKNIHSDPHENYHTQRA